MAVEFFDLFPNYVFLPNCSIKLMNDQKYEKLLKRIAKKQKGINLLFDLKRGKKQDWFEPSCQNLTKYNDKQRM